MQGTEAAELEPAFVGSLLLRDDAVFDVPTGFSSAVLGNAVSRKVFEAVERLAKANKRIDLPLVAAEAGLVGDQVAWLRRAVDQGTTYSARPHAERLLERHRRARMAEATRSATEALERGDRPILDVAAEVSVAMAGLSSAERPDTVTVAEVHDRVAADIRAKRFAPQLMTGFTVLDSRVCIRPGNLVVLAAQSGVGKSTLALNIAENVARRGGHVLVHSLEMETDEIWARIAARSSRVPVDRYANGSATDEQLLAATTARIDRLHLNCAQYGLSAILHLTEKLHRRHGLKLTVIDYLGLVEVPGNRETEEARLATASRSFKQLAQRLQIPVLLVHQLNRDVDRRQDRKGQESTEPLPPPRLSDLRGSGRIGQDANAVLMLHNPNPEKREGVNRYELRAVKLRMGSGALMHVYGHLAFAEFTETESGKAVAFARRAD